MSDSHRKQLWALNGHISQIYVEFVTGFLERTHNVKSQLLDVTH